MNQYAISALVTYAKRRTPRTYDVFAHVRSVVGMFLLLLMMAMLMISWAVFLSNTPNEFRVKNAIHDCIGEPKVL